VTAKRCGCGALMDRSSTVCRNCYIAGHERERHERWARVAELWADGLSLKEIALAVGKKPAGLESDMTRMRNAGWDLPYRRKGWKGFERTPWTPAEELPKTRDESRRRFRQALKNGWVKPPDACERCGREGRVDGHHIDYSRPLYVEWLCRSCHMAHHAAERSAA
jgi:hypothetical protein